MPEQEECYFCVGREIVVMYKRDTVFPTLWPNFTLLMLGEGVTVDRM